MDCRKTRQVVKLVASVATISAMPFMSFPAKAAFIVTFAQDGSDVVATGSGSLDVTDLELTAGGVSGGSQIDPSAGDELVSPEDASSETYKGISGPTSFGAGGFFSTGVQTGADVIGIEASFDELLVSGGYASGAPLSGTATFLNQTFASLGLTAGTYVWTWGSGAHADSYQIDIGSEAGVVPEPATWAMMLAGFAGLSFAGWRAQRKRAALAA